MAILDQSTTPRSALGYQPGLDGLRAIAVLAVIGYHLGLDWMPRGGAVGVTLFFSLSGYLITTLLLREIDASGRVRLLAFYARRALRLFPALLLVVGAVAAYATWWASVEQDLSVLPWVLLYLGNWYRASEGFGSMGLLDHTWTLSVEEQFYLLWPPIVLLVVLVAGAHRAHGAGAERWRRRLLGVALAGCLLPLLLRLLIWDGIEASAARVLNGTDTAADPLMMGCALAIAVALTGGWGGQGDGARRLHRALRVGVWPAAAFLITDAVIRLDMHTETGVTIGLLWGPTALGLASTVVIGWTVLRAPAVLEWRPLRAIGVISYGLYLWHWPLIRGVVIERGGDADLPGTLQAALLLASLAVAGLSYWALEKPLLRLKRHFPPGQGWSERRPPGAERTDPPATADAPAAAEHTDPPLPVRSRP